MSLDKGKLRQYGKNNQVGLLALTLLLLLWAGGQLYLNHQYDSDRIYDKLDRQFSEISALHQKLVSGQSAKDMSWCKDVNEGQNIIVAEGNKLVSTCRDYYPLISSLSRDDRSRFELRGDHLYLFGQIVGVGSDEQARAYWSMWDISLAHFGISASPGQGYWEPGVLKNILLDQPWLQFWVHWLVLLICILFGVLAYRFFRLISLGFARRVGIWLAFVLSWRVAVGFLLGGSPILAPSDLCGSPHQIMASVSAIVLLIPLNIKGFVYRKSWSALWSSVHYLLILLILWGLWRYFQLSGVYDHPVVSAGGLFRQDRKELSLFLGLLLPGLPVVYIVLTELARCARWQKTLGGRLSALIAPILLVGLSLFWAHSVGMVLFFLVLFCILFGLTEFFILGQRWSFGWIVFSLVWISVFTAWSSRTAYMQGVQDQVDNAMELLEADLGVRDLESFGTQIWYTHPGIMDLRGMGLQVALYNQDSLVWHNVESWPENRVRQTSSASKSVRDTGWQIQVHEHVKPVSLLSFFSYHFALLSIALLAFLLLYSYVPHYWRGSLSVGLRSENSLGDKIQSAIIASILFSFAIIALITLVFFKDRFAQNRKSDAERQLSYIRHNLSMRLSEQDICRPPYCYWEQYDSWGRYSGNAGEQQFGFPSLLGSAERSWWQDRVVTLERYGETSLHRVGIRQADTHTVMLVSNQGELSAFTMDRFVSTLLNVYLFLFLLTSVIAMLLSESISRPLAALRARLQEFRLGRRNAKLVWNKNDEIGELIRNYNEMVAQLEESAALMAMNERDSAWREMARQVAHEIKNPLTPMKLRVQHLLFTIQREPDKAEEHVKRVYDTLIEQIDNLSRIANEFSSFGQMPKAQNEKIILNDVVASVHDLFRKREDIQIHLNIPIDEIYVFADRYHINRILTNLLKNAIQSIPRERQGRIDIRLTKVENNALITVQDNGSGIPKDKQASVFKPNFTTKNSGTGLGLAICANLVDMFNGRIYFRSKDDVGTTFFVEIPMMRLEENYSAPKKVEL